MLKKIAGISIITATLFAASHTVDNRWEIGIAGGYMHADKSNQIDDYGLVNVRVGKYLPKNNVLRLEAENGDGTDLTRALLNIEHDFVLDSKITPYAYLGAGEEWASNKDDYNNNFVADFGLGAKYAVTEKINLFAEARALRNFGMNDNHYGALAGISYTFGEKKVIYEDSDKDGVLDNVDKCPETPANVKVDTEGCPLDSDNDGVADYLDKCPNTLEGIKVDANGCSLDSDNDGILDYLDKCPNTPENVKVDTKGCPIDSDNDGVADYLDKCPNSPCGIHVTQNGCSVTFNLDVHFKKASAKLLDTEKAKISKFAKFLKDNIAYNAEIQGYTDNTGPKSYNIKLSNKRAEAVYNYLIKLGISSDRLSYKGYGPANPIADNSTEEGRKLNRRVVAKLSVN